MNKRTISYKSFDGRTYKVTVNENARFWFIDFNTGLGIAAYPKENFTLDQALRNQDHIYDEDFYD